MSTPEQRPLLLEIDGYIERLFVPRDLAFEYALRDAQKAGLPGIHVSRNEGKLLESVHCGKSLDLTGDFPGLEGGNFRVAVGGDDLHG